MSEEQLEKLLNDLPHSIRYSGELEALKQFAREQAGRVQELEDIIYQDERQAVLEELYEENRRYRATINAMGQILKDAIHSLDVGEKVQGLEYGENG